MAEEIARFEAAVSNALANAEDLHLLSNAIPQAEYIVKVRSEHQGQTWWETLNAAQRLADARFLLARPAEDRAKYAQAVRLDLEMERLFGEGKYKEVLNLAQKICDLRREVLGEEHPDYAASLNNVGVGLQLLGRWSEALRACEAALALRQRIYTNAHPDVVNSLNNVAYCLVALGRRAEGLPKYEAALAMSRRLYEGDHPHVAILLNNVAAGLEFVGRPAEALPEYEEALAMRRRLFKGDRAAVANSLDNLAACLVSLGQPTEALPLHQEALAMRQRLFNGDNPDVARSFNNLAACLVALDRTEEALTNHQAALAMRQRLYQGDHPDIALSLNNVGYCLEKLGRWTEALAMYEAALAMWERLLKTDHPDTAKGLNNVAHCLNALGRPGEALAKYREALAMRRRLFAPDHPDLAESLNNAGAVLAATGQREEASRHFLEAMQVQWCYLTRNFPALSPRQKQQFLAHAGFKQSEALWTLVFGAAPTEEQAGLRAALLSKHLLFEAARQENSALFGAMAGASTEWQAKWRERDQLRRQYATLALQSISEANLQQQSDSPKPDPAYIRSLAERIEQLERESREGTPAYAQAARVQEVSLEDVAAALREGEALLEYVRYRPYNFTSNQWSGARYGALILYGGSGQMAAVALGDAEPIDKAVRLFRAEMDKTIQPIKSGVQPSRAQLRRSEDQIALVSSTLRERIWKPLEPKLLDVRRVYIAPDGLLGIVPFEALAQAGSTNGWHYLAEERELVYLGTGRDLARLALSGAWSGTRSNTAVLVGNPAFSAAPEQLAAAVARLRPAALFAQANQQQRAPTLGTAMHPQDQRVHIPRDWRQDAALDRLIWQVRDRLMRLGWSVTTLTNELAVEEAVLGLQSPRLLQFATHGYYLPRVGADGQDWDNPLLHSMLILAGVNCWQSDKAVFIQVGDELTSLDHARERGVTDTQLQTQRVELADGILTAYEVTGINLQDTELVNLTACETGLGEVTPEGVAGLRQAFLLAGVRSLTISLWEVPAKETTDQIADFYRRWLDPPKSGNAGKPAGRYQAFRAAQLAALERARQQLGTAHPFYWAGVLYAGDPGDLPRTQPDTDKNRNQNFGQ